MRAGAVDLQNSTDGNRKIDDAFQECIASCDGAASPEMVAAAFLEQLVAARGWTTEEVDRVRGLVHDRLARHDLGN